MISASKTIKDGSVSRANNSKTVLGQNGEKLFHPQITKYSQQLKRDAPVQDILYEETTRRKIKLKEREKEIYRVPEMQMAKETQKYIIQKF